MTKPAAPPLRTAFLVPRSATAIDADGERRTRLLSEWRDVDAYVLLGDPGAGKTSSFEAEKEDCAGIYLFASDLVHKIAASPPDGETVFIDGLDEVRAGSSDAHTPFGAIREWLVRAGRPRFRLSCREADWRGQADESALARVAPSGQVTVLHLEPLSRDEQRQVGDRVAHEVSTKRRQHDARLSASAWRFCCASITKTGY